MLINLDEEGDSSEAEALKHGDFCVLKAQFICIHLASCYKTMPPWTFLYHLF